LHHSMAVQKIGRRAHANDSYTELTRVRSSAQGHGGKAERNRGTTAPAIVCRKGSDTPAAEHAQTADNSRMRAPRASRAPFGVPTATLQPPLARQARGGGHLQRRLQLRRRSQSTLMWMEAPLEEACFQAEPESAMCVQRFDDSLNSAIRTTYRISLRPSSLREPRYPSAGVVF